MLVNENEKENQWLTEDIEFEAEKKDCKRLSEVMR